MRAFISLDVPQFIRSKLHEFGASIPGKISIVPESNMHITLQFLGEINNASIEKAEAAIGGIHSLKFSVDVSGISFFGNESMHTIYAKINDNGASKHLYLELQQRLSENGINPQHEHSYVPHITLARVKQPSQETAAFISRNSEVSFGAFVADTVSLRQSIATALGPSYSSLYERKLL